MTEGIGKIQEMFKNLNEIVSAQGQTLSRLEDNMVETKGNTQGTVIELSEAIKHEKPTLAERVSAPQRDMTTMCVGVWFVFALFMFCLNFQTGHATKELPKTQF